MTLRCALLGWIVALTISARASDGGELVPMLARLARVAELYRDTALGFSCQETIRYSGETTGRIQFAYLFTRDDSGRLRDFRTWRMGTTAAKRGAEVDPGEYNVPRYLSSAYLWAFIFRVDRQPLYRFEQRGEEQIGSRRAMTIGFLPRDPIRAGLNDWAGYAWIDIETSQILKVEAYSSADWEKKQRLANDVAMAATRALSDSQTYEIERILTEFRFENNGMRFPSHVEITKTRSSLIAGSKHDILHRSIVLSVTQDYAHYKFFSVRSSDEITRFVNGEAPLR